VGSRAWGLADDDSDVDLRGVFVLPFSWTSGLVEPADTLTSADGSTTYWEHAKAVHQAIRADPNTLEPHFVTTALASSTSTPRCQAGSGRQHVPMVLGTARSERGCCQGGQRCNHHPDAIS